MENNFATLFPGTLHLAVNKGSPFIESNFSAECPSISYPEEQRRAILLIDFIGT